MNKRCFLVSLLVFIIAISFRIHYIGLKQGFHMDEMLSRVICSGNVGTTITMLLSQQEYMSGKDIKNSIFGQPKNDLYTDLYNLRLHNFGDDAHPSLYYSLLRTAVNLADYTPQGFIYAGCGLNLILFVFSFFIMRLILIRLFGDNKLVPIGLAFAFLNTGTISMTLFIRPYELQMLAILIISYVYLIMAEKLKNNENIFNIKDFSVITLSLTLVFWTGYILISYAGLLGLILLWHARRNVKNFGCLICSVICAFGLTYLANLSYFQFLEGQRFANVSKSETNFSTEDYISNFVSYICNLIKYLFYGLIIIISIVGGFFAKNKMKFKGFSLIVCAIIWSLVIAVIVPFPVVRYIVPVFPVMSLLLVVMLNKMNIKVQKVFITIFVSIYLVCGIFPLYKEATDTNIYYPKQAFVIPFGGVIENLFFDNTPKLDKNLPVIIQDRYWYTALYLISNLNDEQMYLIKFDEDNKPSLKKYPSDHFYLFLDLWYNSFAFNKDVNLKSIAKFKTHRCYEVFIKG